MTKKLFLLICCVFALCANAQNVQNKPIEKKYIPPTDPQVIKKLDDWRNMKFGILVHWGIYSVPGIVESWSLMSTDQEWISGPRLKRKMDYDTYKKWYFSLADKFNPVNFDANKWADIMNDAGAKYLIFTTKHHDGFCMYDSKYTDFGIAHGPFAKDPRHDLTKQLFNAFRNKGLWVGAYYSKPDWHNPDLWNPYYSTGHVMEANYDTLRHPDWWNRYKIFVRNQIGEITTNYGNVDLMWLDGSSLHVENLGIDSVLTEARKRNPGMLVIDRGNVGPWMNYFTPELTIPKKQLDDPWESCMKLGLYWSWRPDQEYRPARDVINILTEIVAKGGSLALGVGPKPDGAFEQRVIDILHSVGLWLNENGKAIYSTRSAKIYNDGHTWFTADKNGKTLYAIYALPIGEKLPASITWKSNVPTGKMKLLCNNKTLKYKVNGDDVTVTLPKGMKEDSFALSFNIK
jgi:alpha-L-fucosidase